MPEHTHRVRDVGAAVVVGVGAVLTRGRRHPEEELAQDGDRVRDIQCPAAVDVAAHEGLERRVQRALGLLRADVAELVLALFEEAPRTRSALFLAEPLGPAAPLELSSLFLALHIAGRDWISFAVLDAARGKLSAASGALFGVAAARHALLDSPPREILAAVGAGRRRLAACEAALEDEVRKPAALGLREAGEAAAGEDDLGGGSAAVGAGVAVVAAAL